MKHRIIIETTKENKEELQKLAKEQGLTLKDYLVLTGLKKLKVKQDGSYEILFIVISFVFSSFYN